MANTHIYASPRPAREPKVYIPKTTKNIGRFTRQDHRRKLARLVGPAHAHLVCDLRYDNEALWSFTDFAVTTEICEVLLALGGGGSRCTVADITAGAGGSALGLAAHFEAVHAVELDPGRAAMLAHNARVFGAENITIHQGYFQEFIDQICPDIVFFDPPWGLSYRQFPMGTLRLGIAGGGGEVPVEDIVCSIVGRARLCVVKLPFNYDNNHFVEQVGAAAEIIWHKKYKYPNTMQIIILRPGPGTCADCAATAATAATD